MLTDLDVATGLHSHTIAWMTCYFHLSSSTTIEGLSRFRSKILGTGNACGLAVDFLVNLVSFLAFLLVTLGWCCSWSDKRYVSYQLGWPQVIRLTIHCCLASFVFRLPAALQQNLHLQQAGSKQVSPFPEMFTIHFILVLLLTRSEINTWKVAYFSAK